VNANDYLFAGLAFALATLGNSLALPLASQVGKRFGLVRRRRSAGRRRHGSASFLGGVTLAVVATTCVWIAGALSLKTACALAGGGLLLIVGLADDRSSGGSFEMCEDVTLAVRERTTECCGVTSKVGFDRVIGLLFKWLPRHGSRFPDGG